MKWVEQLNHTATLVAARRGEDVNPAELERAKEWAASCIEPGMAGANAWLAGEDGTLRPVMAGITSRDVSWIRTLRDARHWPDGCTSDILDGFRKMADPFRDMVQDIRRASG